MNTVTRTRSLRALAALVGALVVSSLCSCKSAEEAFIDDRMLSLCDEAYWICDVAAGCVLEGDEYIEGIFPGVRRVVVDTEEEDVDIRVRLFFSKMEAPGTELLVQLYEPDCTINPDLGQVDLVDVDLFDEAGDDRILTFDLAAQQIGEHLLEIYSDSSVEYLLIADEK
jgi:hypothetical protein